MPKKLERKLLETAKRRGYSAERTARYVYGTLRKPGWKPRRKR